MNGHGTSQVENRLMVLGFQGIWGKVKDEVLEHISYEKLKGAVGKKTHNQRHKRFTVQANLLGSQFVL